MVFCTHAGALGAVFLCQNLSNANANANASPPPTRTSGKYAVTEQVAPENATFYREPPDRLFQALCMKSQVIFHERGNEIITVIIMLVAAQREGLLRFRAGGFQ